MIKKIATKNKNLFYKKKNNSSSKAKVKFTIITVVLNAEKDLERTIKSVVNQSYKNYEYIIVYTPSTDKTWNIILRNKKYINKILINNKLGVYPPMNLGTNYSEGEYINFLNSGDFFYNKKTLYNVSKFVNQNYDVIYGDSVVKYDNYVKKVPVLPFNKIFYGMIFSHQSCFIKLNLQKNYQFNLKYLYSSDYDLILKLYNKKSSFFKINKPLSISKSDGIADKNRFHTIYENLIIVKSQNNEKYLKSFFYFIKKYFYFKIIMFLKIFLPSNLFYKIKKYKNEIL